MKPFHGRTVLFDLDGTLIDHFRIIYRCYCYALEKLQLPPVSFGQVKAAVGGSIVVTFGKLIPAEKVPEAVVLFREFFDQIWHEDIEVLAGAEWLLQELHSNGYKLAVLTNKEGHRSRDILQLVGLSQYLDLIAGTLDTPFRKPEPEFTRYALDKLGSDPRDSCVVGDSPYDIATGHNLNLPVYTVATGSHSVEELKHELHVNGVFEDLYQLGESVFNLKPVEKDS